MNRIIGYARCSTSGQNTSTQVDALKEAGCLKTFQERISSRTPFDQRHQLQACLSVLDEGDELVVTKLDRLGRTQVEVVNLLSDLQQKKIHIRTLDGLISTKNLGKMAPLVVGLLTGLSEVERSLIRERTLESVAYRRKTGGNLGGRPSLPKIKTNNIKKLRSEGHSLRQIVTLTGVSLSAVQKVCKEDESKVNQ